MILCLCPNPSVDSYAWLQNFQQGKVNRIDDLKKYPGGKGTHVAIAVQQLGAQSVLMASWAGESGNWIKHKAEQFGVQTTGIELSGQNRTCYTFRSQNSELNNTEIIEPGPTMTDSDWELFKSKFETEIQQAELICASGSWPAGAPENAYQQLIQIANKHEKKLILDCSGVQLKHALNEQFFGLHINEYEAEAYVESENLQYIMSELSQKVQCVALTKGKKGLYLRKNNQTIHANVTIDHVISTVGSGDCLTAGIAFAESQEKNMEQIAAYGVACGSANCMHEALGIFKIEDVNELLKKVSVKQKTHV